MPAPTFDKSSVVALFDHKKVYVPTVETLISIEPLETAHDVLAMAELLRVNGALLLATVAEVAEVQPFEPVTVTL